MLQKLSPQQEQQLDGITKSWISTVTSGVTDDESAKRAIRKMYQRVGLTLPQEIFFYDSPLECSLHIYLEQKKLGELFVLQKIAFEPSHLAAAVVQEQVTPECKNYVAQKVCEPIMFSLGEGENIGNLKEDLPDLIFQSVHGKTWGDIWEKVLENVKINVKENIPENIQEELKNAVGDIHQIHWDMWNWAEGCALFELLCQFVKKECALDGMADLIRSRVSWAWFYEKAAFVVRMPELNRNKEGFLHAINKPAVLYPNGYGLWFENGQVMAGKNK